ncbi:hypothetical protein [Muriicola marianensis]|uniref:hypothetical protein n=1 Tax=Muriicola marianensis TaxID=1324801 RepID=UPI00166D7E55|nr:hypothetical protein [Muriicola marianensis]
MGAAQQFLFPSPKLRQAWLLRRKSPSDGNCFVKGLDCFLAMFGSGLGGGCTKKAIRHAVHGAAFSFATSLTNIEIALPRGLDSFLPTFVENFGGSERA